MSTRYTDPKEAVNPTLCYCEWCDRLTAWHRAIQSNNIELYYCYDHFGRGEEVARGAVEGKKGGPDGTDRKTKVTLPLSRVS